MAADFRQPFDGAEQTRGDGTGISHARLERLTKLETGLLVHWLIEKGTRAKSPGKVHRSYQPSAF
jgi:hypothetical protein